jgi:hypothetical protein
MKNHKIDHNLATTEPRKKKWAHIWNSKKFGKIFNVLLSGRKNNQILLNTINWELWVATKLITGWNIPIEF